MSKTFRRLVAAAAVALSTLLSPPARAQIPADCTELGVAITEHSCFHSILGPFSTVMATAGSSISSSTPNIDPVHTEYRIGLTGEYSVVTYTPQVTGAWAIFLGKDVPINVLAGTAEALTPVYSEKGTTDCEALPLLHAFELTSGTKYRFVFGPTAERTVVAVVEYIDSFRTQNGRDADGDGFGSKDEVIDSPCKPPEGFAPNTRDCNDADPLIHPDAIEVCGDGVDQNCNGSEGDAGLACRVGTGACRVEGATVCAAGGVAECDATPAAAIAEACNGKDDDCNGTIDDGPDLCPDADRPTCIRAGNAAKCGCQIDLDCGDVSSGRICNTETGVCQDGCSAFLGGNNNCGAGEACSPKTGRCEPESDASGAGGAEGASGGASASGSGGVSGSAPSGASEDPSLGGEPSDSGSHPVSKKDGGCGCRVAGPPSSPATGVGVFGLAMVLSYLRRRSQRARGSVAAAALAATSLVGCGARLEQNMGAPAGGKGGSEPVATGASATGASTTGGSSEGGTGSSGGSGATAAAGTDGGGAPTLPPQCVPVLGPPLVEHACSHTDNGPFIPVATGGDIEPPDVSELHRTYEVQVTGPKARLLYRAQRQGTHAFLTNLPAKFELRRDGKPIRISPSFAVDGCSTISTASVCDLERDADYEIYLLESPTSLNLFVEHVNAFGGDAWQEPCDLAPDE